MHAVLDGVTRDQMMARHKANHIHVAYANSARDADLAMYAKAALASGQIARRLGLPLRSSNTTTSNCVDAQAAYESGMSLWGAIMGHANLVYHAAGWLESGLTASFEKLITDAEMLQMMAEFLRPIEVNAGELALDEPRIDRAADVVSDGIFLD